MPLNRLNQLDILQIARDKLGFHGTGGCCGNAAMAINEVLFDNQGQIVMAVNKTLLQRDEDFVGHVGVLDESGVIWDSETVYVGKEGFEDFMEWGIIAPDDPEYNVTEEEGQNAEVYIFDSVSEARKAISGGTKCPHTDLASVLRAAVKIHFGGKG